LDSEDELRELNQLSDGVAKFFSDKVDSAKMDHDAKFEPAVVEVFIKLFFVHPPQEVMRRPLFKFISPFKRLLLN